ncbi:hypothetical protein KEU06_08915 [Pseudaminobacter sp. 19-2017]|uniref:Uncharacterized protein n=1 Tax=Pseudaminobacter soli (ex Zhang et al. 2022) TaxID=2831468 RepID=A0A942DX20_9HYPH|nr:hypothetical protein [Pseudaminobacter soli]MBS3648748.1 hypothetical protein [Pseudaminobacter soli]
MAFGARQHDDKSWRLCHRKGRTILFWKDAEFPGVEIVFASQAKAKACADSLNERWKEYEQVEFGKRKPKTDPQDLINFIFAAIVEHGGLTTQAQKILTG